MHSPLLNLRTARWLAALFFSVPAGLSVLAAEVATTDWPQFLGPARNGVYAGRDLAATWARSGPPIRWQRAVGDGFSGPVIAGGRLVLFHQTGGKETVECLDALTGKPLWQTGYGCDYSDDMGRGEGPRATPAVAGGRVFTFGVEGVLHGWSLATGEKLWSVDTRKTFSPAKGFFGVASSPLVEGDAVILNVGGRNHAGIVAFDAATGKMRWQTNRDEASYSSPVAVNIGGQRRLLVVTRERLAALQPANGRLFWEYDWRPPMHASVTAATPLVIDDLIFLSASYGTGATLLRYKESGPEKIWAEDDVLSNHYATSVHHGGFLYGFDGRQEQGCNLRCVELKTGKVRWSEERFGAGTLLLAGGDLLILTEKGELVRAPASPDAFKPSARAQILPFKARAHAALAGGLLYARSADKLVCVDLRPLP